MSDDSFIREVDEELRTERFQDFWTKYGKLAIGVAVAIVLATAGYRFYEYYTAKQAAEAGDAFMAAVSLAQEGKQEEALGAFEKLEGQGSKSYQTLALMRGAAELAKSGQVDEAVKKFDAISGDTEAEENLRSIARIRAAMLLVDSGSVADVEARVSSLSAPGAAYRASAREALGLAHYKAGDLENAFKQFNSLVEDSETPQALAQRTRIILDLIASKGGPVRDQ
ncbi:MAG: tetratricopeptide repeat protein [Rhizobiaceae bacterium]|nr:tetratricopeptide repeat protein [Rhizobiaceae bacterium]